MANLYTQATPPVDSPYAQPPVFQQSQQQYGAPSPFQPPPGFSQYQHPSGQYTSPPPPIVQQQAPYPPPAQLYQQPQFQPPQQSSPPIIMSEKPQNFQPQPTVGMSVQPGGGGNRNAKNLPMDAEGREWSHGLCDCCSDAGTCILAWCCPCIVYAQNKQRYQHLSTKGYPDPEHGGSGCNGDCFVHGCITACFGAGWVLQIGTRGNIRDRYRIKGGGCGDCLTACFCTPCELTQESRELELEEKSPSRMKLLLFNKEEYNGCPSSVVHQTSPLICFNLQTVADVTADFPDAIPCLNGYRPLRSIRRRLLPRRPGRDAPLEQHCTLYESETDAIDAPSLVVLTPIIEEGFELPYYHPRVHHIGFRFIDGDTPSIRIELLPLPETPTDLNSRLYRTCLALLDTVHRYGWGAMVNYQKRVIHDNLVPREAYQDLYLEMRERYKHLIDTWQEVTDPLKHVFEDIGIATYLMLLWKDMYANTNSPLNLSDGSWPRPPGGFLDLGCGNGLLTHILASEGYEGQGIDVRARTSWSAYPATTQKRLLVHALNPLARKDDEDLFKPEAFLIGNHADELTPWVPVLSTLHSASGYISIPCCAFTFDSRYQRSQALPYGIPEPDSSFVESLLLGGHGNNESSYSKYRIWLASLSVHCGWDVECDNLRIPSTRNWALIASVAWSGQGTRKFEGQMCFPSKRQKNNFADESKTPATQNGTKAPAPPAVAPSTKPPTPPPQPVADSTSPPAQETKPEEPKTTMAPKVAIITYSMYGHINKVADAVLAGIKEAGGTADRYQVAETLPQEVLTKMYAPAKADIPLITPEILATYDAFLIGIPTRYGNFPAQWKAFWDSTGQLWASGALAGKYAGVFISTASLGGGQESTAIASMSTLAHHGIIYVPLGYSRTFGQLTNLTEVHGGSPWGAGTFAGPDGSRQPSALELEIATIQGKYFYELVSKVNF
ncbi:hypothetical protein ONZ45_g9035 [Pleurotus djamor]|nr:hypothetical protein ONZ45_g9035 [Pleurotus djamor]